MVVLENYLLKRKTERATNWYNIKTENWSLQVWKIPPRDLYVNFVFSKKEFKPESESSMISLSIDKSQDTNSGVEHLHEIRTFLANKRSGDRLVGYAGRYRVEGEGSLLKKVRTDVWRLSEGQGLRHEGAAVCGRSFSKQLGRNWQSFYTLPDDRRPAVAAFFRLWRFKNLPKSCGATMPICSQIFTSRYQ